METERLFIADIQIGERHRAVDVSRVAILKSSIEEIGLRTPITVTGVREGTEWVFRLVAGAHRLEALRQTGEELVDALVIKGDDADLWEIDENLARAELSDTQRADHHARRERILVARGTVAPGTRGGKRQNVVSYSEQAATALGVDKRTIQRDLSRGKKISPEILAEVSGTDLDKGVVLDELAQTPREEQSAKIAEIRERRSMVRPAADPLNDPEAHEKQLSALMSAWNRAAAVVRQEFLLRIDGPVFEDHADRQALAEARAQLTAGELETISEEELRRSHAMRSGRAA